MIKREYFISAKVAHNDNSEDYSWWYATFTTTGWRDDTVTLMRQLREDAVEIMQKKVERKITEQDIEILSFNRI